MKNENSMVVLIAGASGGFGSVLAKFLADEGMTVYGTSRNPSTAEAEHPFPMLAMETTDSNSVENCVNEVLEREGRIDVLVNCVIEMIIGSVEEVSSVYHSFSLHVLHAAWPIPSNPTCDRTY